MQLSSFGADQLELKDTRGKASYGIGVFFGNQIKRSSMDVDVDVVAAAIKDLLAGRDPRLTEKECQEAIKAYQLESQAKAGEKNTKEGEAFLAANKKKDGVKTHTVTLPDGKTAEMQYKVITEGTGAMPKSNDIVSVNYRGTLINGKEFDSSAKRNAPLKMAANQLVKGWTEALQMMKTGSKWELYLPAALAYGDRGGQGIEPGTTLIFEMELLSFETPQPPAPPQPLTSDIIRVPSAEELKAGAKVEVIKAEDLEKQAKAAAATNNPTKKP
jgi:FKBP-type peptidyl-prolyl cis-trans isomerase FklB